jgi:SNF2 family DNA or RNA helicase
MKKITLIDKVLKIDFQGRDFMTMLGKIKTLSGRKFCSKIKPVYWTCPPIFENFEKLEEWGFVFDSACTKAWKKLNEVKTIDLSNHPALKGAYPFQVEGVEFWVNNNLRALIGDEMGLGKTVQALCCLKLYPELRPAVIVCPASLKLNWEKECNTWLPKSSINIISGGSGAVSNEDIQIINYDIMDKRVNILISEIKPKVLILDEIHYIKNKKSLRSKAVKKLAKKCGSIIGLSGTPIINRPIEFFPILNLLDSMRWGSSWKYAHDYCDAKHNGFGWDFTGSSNPEALHEAVKRTMIRRLKKDVLPDLPAKIRTVIPLEITNRKAYNSMVEELDASDSPAIQLTRIESLKQLVVEGKQDAIKQWLVDYFESNKKLIIFCEHKKTVVWLQNALDSIKIANVSVVGGMSVTQKQNSIDLFNNDPNIRGIIGSKAMKEGHSMTSTSNTAFVELWWTPGDHDQAEDRVLGIKRGDGSYQCNAYYLLGNDTIDMEISELLDRKRKVLDSVLDGKETEETSLLTELMKRIVKPVTTVKRRRR